jgi:hypothetical protein
MASSRWPLLRPPRMSGGGPARACLLVLLGVDVGRQGGTGSQGSEEISLKASSSAHLLQTNTRPQGGRTKDHLADPKQAIIRLSA